MKTTDLLRRLHIENKEFLTSRELKSYCKSGKLDYKTTVRYFEMRGYLVRIFRGTFYVKSPEELKIGRGRYNHLELVARGMEIKGVKNWYFGLHSALKLNNMTHEHFAIEDVINDSIFRPKPMTIAGYKFKFVKLSPSLLNFGITKKDCMRYSDPEKTILDFIYIWRYNGIPSEKIISDVSDWAENISKKRLEKHSKKYPKSVEGIVKRMIH